MHFFIILPSIMSSPSLPSFQAEHYRESLDNKIHQFKTALEQALDAESIPPLEVFESPAQFYRMRAEFKVWHTGDKACYAMTHPETKKPIFLDTFPVASKTINSLMPPLMAAINDNDTLRKKCFQIEFLSTQTGDTLVTLIYHKKLDEAWEAAITPIKTALGIHVIGRSRKQKIVLDRDYVNETLQVANESYNYHQAEGSFTQPNAVVCEKMLAWAVDKSRNLPGDLLELYCGNGNFTLPLSKNFRRVLATEISKTSVYSARENIQRNQIDNIEIARMSSEEFVEALDKVRSFNRLKHINLDDYDFSSVFVDPPRAGLDPATLATVQRFDHIIYISCKPETLIDNLNTLTQTHRIKAIAAFDQFPYTHHLESGVVLQKI